MKGRRKIIHLHSWKTASESAFMTDWGRSFHHRSRKTEKSREPLGALTGPPKRTGQDSQLRRGC
ncbi:hypothetical protein ANANG_G00145730 [Anguilla anguilla]|uniref:Uncharacterized protein n=1 Tax=Anguilla anguilla TaxID=7936 RepID=A0A9D3MBP6_ANGAN|nr:hypothetical protein ANANG_G00145730 [Anguilla anguilla]